MVKKTAIIILCSLCLGGLIAIGNSLFRNIACEGQPINNNVLPTTAQQIFGERVIGQTFVAPRHGLNRIDIFFQTYGRRNSHDITLRLFEITENNRETLPAGIELFSATFNAASVSDQSWRSFPIEPVSNSAGKTYLITLESPESTDGNAITVGGIERNSYLPGTAFLGSIPVPADITFRSCYRMTTTEKLQVFSEQITRNRPGVWGNISFYWFSLLVYGLLLIGFFWELT